MKTTTLNFYERIVLGEIIGQQEGRLADIAVYLKILDKVRLSEQERKESQMKVDDGQLKWMLPEAEYGMIVAEFEDEEARRLAQLLESWPKVTIRDAGWIGRVSAELKR